MMATKWKSLRSSDIESILRVGFSKEYFVVTGKPRMSLIILFLYAKVFHYLRYKCYYFLFYGIQRREKTNKKVRNLRI